MTNPIPITRFYRSDEQCSKVEGSVDGECIVTYNMETSQYCFTDFSDPAGTTIDVTANPDFSLYIGDAVYCTIEIADELSTKYVELSHVYLALDCCEAAFNDDDETP